MDSGAADGVAPDPASGVAERDVIDHLLAGLPPRQRAVVVLRFYLDLDHEGIADALGISAGSARSTLTRALANLRVLHPESESVEGERR